MKLSWRTELPPLIVVAAMFALAAWAWPRVPDRIPIHWNIHGEVDGWGSKLTGLIVIPITTLGLYGMLLLVPFADPGKDNYRNFSRIYAVVRLALILVMAALHTACIFAALGYLFNMTSVACSAMGILLIVLGNYMSKIRPNWFLGVRTPWTLSSRLSWDKTHRLAGWLFIPMGAMFLIVAAVPSLWTWSALIIVNGFCLVWMVLYSYFVFRHDPHRTSPAGTSPVQE
jgi:uncharacterized membrane protein